MKATAAAMATIRIGASPAPFRALADIGPDSEGQIHAGGNWAAVTLEFAGRGRFAFDVPAATGYNLTPVRIITIGALRRFWEQRPDSERPLREWHAKTNMARWRNPVEVKATFPQVDFVKVSSGNTVFVFNITRAYRLIAAIHFDYPRVFVLRVLTHSEYDLDNWKSEL